MRPLLLLVFVFLFSAPLAAQDGPVQVDPGMSREQVIERLGRPANERSSGGFTYLFFINGCERTCGMNDLVTLKGDSVVDAIFRTPRREYTGRSTSPAQNRTPRANRGPLTVGGTRPDSVVMRIVPADSNSPPPERRPIEDLRNRPVTPTERPDSARPPASPPTTPPPVDRVRPVSARTTAPVASPDPRAQTPPGPPPQTGATINPPTISPDTSRNTPGTRPDTTRGGRLPVTRSDTVMNPRTPTVIAPRPDSAARPAAGRPVTPPPATQPPSVAPPSP